MDAGDRLERAASELMAEVGRELARRRVPWSEREDVAQDVLLWFLRHWTLFSESQPILPLVRTVVGRFLRSKNLRRYETQRLEPAAELESTEIPRVWHEGASRVALREILAALPPRERRLAVLLARGATWVEACNQLGIRPGSRSFFRERLRGDLRRLVA